MVDAVLSRSRVLPAVVALGVGFTLALLVSARLPLAITLLLATWAVCVGLDAVRRGVGVRSLSLGRDGAISLDGGAGLLREGSFVAPWLTVIRWRPAGARFDYTVLIVPDMLSREDFRRLRVLLRWS
ncbi:MAG: protein YgfX [Usitatibacter sp.]